MAIETDNPYYDKKTGKYKYFNETKGKYEYFNTPQKTTAWGQAIAGGDITSTDTKISSILKKLINKSNDDKITVFLYADTDKTTKDIDLDILKEYGAEVIKSSDSVMKISIPANKLENMANNVGGIRWMDLPDKPEAQAPVRLDAEPLTLTSSILGLSPAGNGFTDTPATTPTVSTPAVTTTTSPVATTTPIASTSEPYVQPKYSFNNPYGNTLQYNTDNTYGLLSNSLLGLSPSGIGFNSYPYNSLGNSPSFSPYTNSLTKPKKQSGSGLLSGVGALTGVLPKL